MTFTIIVDADTSSDKAGPYEVRAEIERLLKTTARKWRFKVWPAEQAEIER